MFVCVCVSCFCCALNLFILEDIPADTITTLNTKISIEMDFGLCSNMIYLFFSHFTLPKEAQLLHWSLTPFFYHVSVTRAAQIENCPMPIDLRRISPDVSAWGVRGSPWHLPRRWFSEVWWKWCANMEKPVGHFAVPLLPVDLTLPCQDLIGTAEAI